jgi:hypothetical protein
MRCPVCRAENTEATCRRCRADLTLLFAVEAERRRLLALAAEAAAHGDGERVVEHARDAHDLRRDQDSARWLALGHLLKRDFAAAFRGFRSLTLEHS